MYDQPAKAGVEPECIEAPQLAAVERGVKIVDLDVAIKNARYWVAFRNSSWSGIFPILPPYNTFIEAPPGQHGRWTMRHRRFASMYISLWGRRLAHLTLLPICKGRVKPGYIRRFGEYKVVAFTTQGAARAWLGQ